MKICLIASSGGHLAELEKLSDAFPNDKIFLVTYKERFLNIKIKADRSYLIKNFIVQQVDAFILLKILIFFFHFFYISSAQMAIFLKENPRIVISTGSEIAIPMFFIAKVFRRKTIFIESICRTEDISLTGKIVIKICDLFIVQWPELVKRHPSAEFHGNILNGRKDEAGVDYTKENLIFVSVGTASFDRLIKMMDEIAERLPDKILMQTGNSEYQPKHAEFFKFINHDEMLKVIRRSSIFVTHAGAGNISSGLDLNTPMIVVPRRKKEGEVADDHQMELSRKLARENLLIVAETSKELEEAIELNRRRSAGSHPKKFLLSQNGLVQFIHEKMIAFSNT